MKLQLNPLTLLFLLGVYLVSLFSAETWSSFGWHLAVLIFFGKVQRLKLRPVGLRIFPVLLYLPIMTLLYSVISLAVSSDPLLTIILQALWAAARILLLVSAMSLFLELVPSFVLIDAARTSWYRFQLKWRRVEDLFQLLDLVLRFLPMVTVEVKALMALEKTLSFSSSFSRRERIMKIARHLPTLIVNCIYRAGQIGLAMEGRGYGTVLPRSIAIPVVLAHLDRLVILLSITFLVARLFIA
ncbi:MAG: energy-coupling factor transporter transmembrane component T [Candidatus Neomarinimicrobiota bacterium]|nr:energy-coupling factor transporter transmembrane component T [Candidatus Neomarinimicrobiota bacterium]